MRLQQLIEWIVLTCRLSLRGQYWKSESKTLLTTIFAVLGIIWTFIQIVNQFFPSTSSYFTGAFSFGSLVALAAIIAYLIRRPKLRYTCRVAGKDVTLSLQIGNILYRDGDLVVGTNTTFDTSLRQGFISPNSVQGQLVAFEYDNIEHADSEIERALSDAEFEEIPNRSTKTKRYPIGTVAKLEHRSARRSYWVALTDVNEHGKPDGEYQNLMVGLQELWITLETRGHLTDMFMPILGTGRTGFNATRSQTIKDIILSFITFSQSKRFINSLTICINPGDLEKHDLNPDELFQYMDYQCRFRFDASNLISSSTKASS